MIDRVSELSTQRAEYREMTTKGQQIDAAVEENVFDQVDEQITAEIDANVASLAEEVTQEPAEGAINYAKPCPIEGYYMDENGRFRRISNEETEESAIGTPCACEGYIMDENGRYRKIGESSTGSSGINYGAPCVRSDVDDYYMDENGNFRRKVDSETPPEEATKTQETQEEVVQPDTDGALRDFGDETPVETVQTPAQEPSDTPQVTQAPASEVSTAVQTTEASVQTESTEPPAENSDVFEFGGYEFSSEGNILKYINKIELQENMTAYEFDTIYSDLLLDKSVNAFDKFKMLSYLDEKGVSHSPVEKYTQVLDDMAENTDKYSFDEIKEMNSKYMQYLKESHLTESYPFPNKSSGGIAYKTYCNAMLKLREAYKGDSENYAKLDQMASISELAKGIQFSFSDGDETQRLTRLAACSQYSGADCTSKRYSGFEDKFNKLSKVLEAYKNGYESGDGQHKKLTEEAALHCFTELCGDDEGKLDVEKLIKSFRKLGKKDQERYIEDLFKILG